MEQEQVIDLRMRRHFETLAAIVESEDAVYKVVQYYRLRGRHVFLPTIKLAPTPEEAHNYRDDYDLQLLYQGVSTGMGVKHLKHVFHGPPGTPVGWPWGFDHMIVGAVDDVDDGMLDYVEQWALVSLDFSTMIWTHVDDREHWYVKDVQGKITGEYKPHYVVSPLFCEFYELKPPAVLNSEDIIPMPWIKPTRWPKRDGS